MFRTASRARSIGQEWAVAVALQGCDVARGNVEHDLIGDIVRAGDLTPSLDRVPGLFRVAGLADSDRPLPERVRQIDPVAERLQPLHLLTLDLLPSQIVGFEVATMLRNDSVSSASSSKPVCRCKSACTRVVARASSAVARPDWKSSRDLIPRIAAASSGPASCASPSSSSSMTRISDKGAPANNALNGRFTMRSVWNAVEPAPRSSS